MASLDAAHFKQLADEGYNLIPLYETLQLDRETPVSLYHRLRDRAIYLLESAALGEATGRYSFIGLDRLWRLTAHQGSLEWSDDFPGLSTEHPLIALRERLNTFHAYLPSELPDFFGGAVGFVSYDYVRRIENLPRHDSTSPWPDVDFSCAGVTLICDHLRHSTTVVVNVLVASPTSADTDYQRAREQLSELVTTLLGPPPPSNATIEALVATAPSRRNDIDIRSTARRISNFTLDQYRSIVDRAKSHIVAGDVFQVVPSQQFRRPSLVDPLTLYRVLRALNPSPYMYLLDTGDGHLVGASPEMLLRVHDGVVSTRPIAGTRPRGTTASDDTRLELEMRSDAKEIAEHVMLVDLGRNDVGRVAEPGTVTVERLAHVERFSHLMHLVSDVHGQLREGLDAFDAFDALFPAGTLTGAPKVRAMELIDTFESVSRGPYGGAVGYFSFSHDADFAITIRTVALRDGVAVVQAGGGVVADSSPEFEYEEAISKASAPLLALEISDPTGPNCT